MTKFRRVFDIAEVKFKGPDGVARIAYGAYKIYAQEQTATVTDPSPSRQHVTEDCVPVMSIPLAHVVHAERISRERYEEVIRAIVARDVLSSLLPSNQGFAQAVLEQKPADAAQPKPLSFPAQPKPLSFPTRPDPANMVARYGSPPAPEEGM